MLQIQDAEGEAVVAYCESSATQVEDPATAGRCGILGLSASGVAFPLGK